MCWAHPGVRPGFRSWLSYPEGGTSGKCHCLSGPQFPLAVKWEGGGTSMFPDGARAAGVSGRFFRGCKKVDMGVKCWRGQSC